MKMKHLTIKFTLKLFDYDKLLNKYSNKHKTIINNKNI